MYTAQINGIVSLGITTGVLLGEEFKKLNYVFNVSLSFLKKKLQDLVGQYTDVCHIILWIFSNF